MPSARHEGLLSLFRHRPEFALELLETCRGVAVPGGAVHVVEPSGTELPPVERRADLVMSVGVGDEVRRVVVVEVQLRRDRSKPRRWPLYATTLGDRHACPVEVLVVTPSRAVARWAAEPVPLSTGRPWWPDVVGPGELPRLDAASALAAPELAVLSAVAHARGRRGGRRGGGDGGGRPITAHRAGPGLGVS
jgi:hypothetical protein